ncbi:MAG: hypothetical protein H6Q74_761 [Firmicutes bacterium]|nr:hypothetical protein [Bacillota bacterium]
MVTSTKGWVTKIAVLFIFLLNVETSLVNTALGEISKAFPGTDPVMINLISTFPVFFALIMSFFIGKLAEKYDKKKLLLWSLIIYIIGGLGGAFINGSIAELLIMRAFVGIGAGMSAPLCGSIIADLFEPKEQAMMLGWSNGFSSLLAVLITMLSGWLCAINWTYTFLAYGIFVFVLLLEMYALPSLPAVVAAAEAETKEKPKYTTKQKVKLGLMGLYVLCNLMVGMLLFMKMPILMTQENIGGPVVIATAFSASTVMACISSLLFGYIVRFFKRYTLAIYSILTALAFFIILSAHSADLVIIALAFNGFAMGMMMPALQLKAISTGPKANATYATSIILGSLFVGQILATFVEKALVVFGDPTPRALFLFGGIMFIVYTVAYLIWIFANPKTDAEIASDMSANA